MMLLSFYLTTLIALSFLPVEISHRLMETNVQASGSYENPAKQQNTHTLQPMTTP